MLISRIDPTNQTLFDALLPEEWARKLALPSVFALGAITDESEGGRQPAGTLVFSIEEGSVGPDALIAATMQWLYVAPSFRDGKTADALMEAFWDIMDQSGIEHILCDVPMPSEYDQLCAYLESWDFRFTLADRYELTLPLQEFTTLPTLQRAPQMHIEPLEQIRQADLLLFLRHVQDQPGVLQELSEELTDYDGQVSCVHTAEGVVGGALLVQQISSDLLEITLLRALSRQTQVLPALCRFAAQAAAKKFPPDMQVRVVCRMDSAAQLIGRLFPDAQPLLVRRGYYNNGAEEPNKAETPADTDNETTSGESTP